MTSPELIQAIKERIALGQSREEIEAEVVSTGYTPEQFASAYSSAMSGTEALVVADFAAANATGNLIPIGDLINQMWKLMLKEKMTLAKVFGVTLLFILGLTLLSFGVFAYLGESNGSLILLFFIGIYLVLITAVGLLYALLVRAILKRDSQETLTSHLKWTISSLLPLIWVGLLMIGLIMTGYLLLIIPGLMMVVYTSMTLNFILDGRARGVDALILSTKYTYGRFWPVLGRLVVTGLVIGLLMSAIIMVGAFTVFLIPLFFLFAIFVSYYGMACAWVLLYESLLAAGPAKPLPVSDSTLKKIYIVFGTIGVFLYAAVMVFSIVIEMIELLP